ncbi:MAG: putative lipase, partial [Pseudonocardiales bacterium]|nr:putative lipase [Pseudonocardiales bacterium]
MPCVKVGRVGVLAAAMCALVLATVAPGSGPAGAAISTPDNDAFYVPPAHFASKSDGSILRSRSITATALSVPLNVRAWQVLFKSVDAHRRPTAEVATVMVPNKPWTGSGSRPLVSYQTAEDGVGSQCAPSYAIRAGLPAATSNAALETPVLAMLLSREWAVVTTDYEGPDSQFLAGPQEGYAVLDGIRAALAFRADGLTPRTPVAMWGYSGGAFATAWAAQLMRSHAPRLRPVGIAMGGLPADLRRSMMRIDGGYGFGLVLGAMVGLDRAYPEARLQSLFTTQGRTEMRRSGSACTIQLVLRYPLRSLADFTYNPHPYGMPRLEDVLAANSPKRAVTGAPVYSYHATGDELVPVAVDDALMSQYCAAGDRVQLVRPAGGSHNTELLTGAAGAMAFLANRFAGKRPVDTCSSSPGGDDMTDAPTRVDFPR